MSNTLIFVGRLTRDAERKQTANSSFLSFSIAEDVGYGDKKKTNFWNCALFGKQSEGSLIDYLNKGSQVKIVGEVSFNEKDGKSYNSVNVQNIELVGSRGDSQQAKPQQQGYAQGGYTQQQAPKPAGGGVSDLEDDLPFAPIHFIEG